MAAIPLRSLSRRPISGLDIMKFVRATKDLPDQALALVAGTLVERMLERTITKRMVRLSKKQHNELFVGLAPIASLSAKIRIALALGIIGERGASELGKIKDIRNQFAHSFHPLAFSTPSISAACHSLTTPERMYEFWTEAGLIRVDKDNPRSRYFVSCMGIAVGLGGKSVNGPRPRRPRGKISRAFLG